MSDSAALSFESFEIFATQEMPEPFADHSAPDFSHGEFCTCKQLLRREDFVVVQPLFHPRPDAGEIPYLQFEQQIGQILLLDDVLTTGATTSGR